jgi:membrane protein
MSRLGDVPRIILAVGPYTFVKRVLQQVLEDNVLTWAAALAYSWLFALFPFAIFLLSLLPLLPERFRNGADQFISKGIEQTLVGESASVVKAEINRILQQPRAGLLSLGIILAIWAASSGMSATMAALDQAYDVTRPRPFWKQRLVAIVLTIVVATLILLVMVLLPIGTAVIGWLDRLGVLLGMSRVILEICRFTLGTLLLFTVLGAIYHFGPSVRRKFHLVTAGSVFCISVWVLVAFGFRYYLTVLGGGQSYSKTYGTVGGIAILLLIFYVDAVVLLVGAEINSELDFARLGIASSNTPEGQKVASLTQSDEDRAFAEELARRRG